MDCRKHLCNSCDVKIHLNSPFHRRLLIKKDYNENLPACEFFILTGSGLLLVNSNLFLNGRAILEPNAILFPIRCSSSIFYSIDV